MDLDFTYNDPKNARNLKFPSRFYGVESMIWPLSRRSWDMVTSNKCHSCSASIRVPMHNQIIELV